MKKQFFALVVVILIISLIPVISSFAQEKIIKVKHEPGRGRFFKELNLTKEQKDQIDKFRFEHKNAAIDIRAQIQKNKLQIKELLKNQNIDESKIRSLVNNNSDLHAKLKKSILDMWFKSYNILDDKQKEMWREHTPFLEGSSKRFMFRKHANDTEMGIQKKVRTFRHEIGENEPEMIDDNDLVQIDIDE